MLVQCPKCKTTYKVSDEAVKGPAPTFRCSRCKHTFEMRIVEDNLGPPSSAGEQAAASSEPTFTLEPRPEQAPEPARGSVKADAAPRIPPEPAGPHATPTPAPSRGASAMDPQTIADTAAPQDPQTLVPPARDNGEKVLSIAPYREQRASVVPLLTLFAFLVVFSLFMFAYQKTHPEGAEGWLARLPLVGASVVRNDHLKNGVLLKSVETRFQLLQGNREALVLTGVAVNQNPTMIRNVQLAGQLFDHEGKEVERQTMWIGNAISPQILRGMSAQDVADLQRLKPLKTFEIPPGDSVPFAIVFLRPGKSLKDARCEVLSVEEA